ncbi:MAG: hypothetical protein J7M06_04200 [Proteobacteria bacterium]|nr:hypothetical protein [Pseudomonadota bacterium]
MLTVDVSPNNGNNIKVSYQIPESYPATIPKSKLSNVRLEAIPAPGSGYEFIRWSGDLTGSNNPGYIYMDSNKTVTAIFSSSGGEPDLSLTVDVSPKIGGKIKVNGSSPGSYPYTTGPYPVDTEVSLEAIEAPGYQFDSWSGNLTGDSNPSSITITSYKTVTANFLFTGDSEVFLYFPHIASNIDGWETEICVISTSDDEETPLIGTFKAYDNSGNSVSKDIEVILPSRVRREIIVGEAFVGSEDIGYIVFETYSDAIVGYTKFYIEGQYRVAVPAVSDSEINTSDIYISHIASDSNWGTGVSLLNTTLAPKTLTIEFDNGETETVSLTANEHKAFTIRSLFGGEAQTGIQSGVIKDAGGVIGLELFVNNPRNWMSGILLKDDTTSSIYYSHTASNDGWATGIVAYNPSDIACDITITPYSAAGYALTSTKDVSIAGKGKYFGTVSALDFPADTAWFQIDATSPITGFELFSRTDQLGGYTGVGISGTEGVFAKIEKDGATGIAFVNIENSSAVVTLTAYDDIGTVIAEKEIILAAHEKVVNSAENIFTENISSATYIAYSSDKEVVGFQLNTSSDNMMLDGLPGM